MLEKKIGFSTDRHKKYHAPPPSFTNKIVGCLIKKTSEWEDMSLHSGTLINIPIPSRPVFVLTCML